MDDIYSLFTAQDEPTAQEQAAGLAAALRRQKMAGNLGLLTGDKVLGGFGQAQLQGAQQLEQQLGAAGRERAQNVLQKTIAAEKRRQELADTASQRRWQEGRDTQRFGQEMLQAQILAGQRERDKQDARDDRKAALDDKAIADDAELLSKRMESVPDLKNDLATLINAAKGDDIAGFGTVAGRFPDFFVSNEGIKNRQAARGIIRATVAETSGKAASDKEVDRILGEMGMGHGVSDDQLRIGLERLAQQARDHIRQKEAGARPEALKMARERGLTTSVDIPQYAPGAGSGLSSEKQKRLEELRAKKAQGQIK